MSGNNTDRGISGSIDVALFGGLIVLPSHYFDIRVGVVLGLFLVALGLAKVSYDHLTGFEDPLGIDNVGRDENQ